MKGNPFEKYADFFADLYQNEESWKASRGGLDNLLQRHDLTQVEAAGATMWAIAYGTFLGREEEQTGEVEEE